MLWKYPWLFLALFDATIKDVKLLMKAELPRAATTLASIFSAFDDPLSSVIDSLVSLEVWELANSRNELDIPRCPKIADSHHQPHVLFGRWCRERATAATKRWPHWPHLFLAP